MEWRNAVSEVYRERPRVLQMVLLGAGLFVCGFAALGFGRLLSGSDAIKIVSCVVQLLGSLVLLTSVVIVSRLADSTER
jgi:hypothetical protein